MKKAYTYPIRTPHNHILTLFERKKAADSKAQCKAAMEELEKIYWHEKQLMIAIPLLLSSATTFELVESLTVLLKHTREHIKTLESKFPNIGRVPTPKRTFKTVSHEDIVR